MFIYPICIPFGEYRVRSIVFSDVVVEVEVGVEDDEKSSIV